MPELILHIGTHKTGTTSVQDQLHAARNVLRENGIVYPDLAPHTGHHGYLTDWIHLPRAYDLPGGGRNHLKQLAEVHRNTDATLLLSSEEFSRAGGPGGSVNFGELREIFDGYKTTVICALRDQISFLQSVYLEISRHTLPARPPEFLATALQTGQVDGLWCDYSKLYMGLRQDFAADEIHLINYEQAKSAPDGVLSAMREKVPKIPVLAPSDSPVWSNASPGILPIWAAQVVAGWTLPSPALYAAAVDAFELEYGHSARQSLFTQAERLAARNVIEGWNADLSEVLARDGKTFEPTSPNLSAPIMTRTDLQQDYWIRLARRLSFQLPQAAA